jgi:ParB/RepB/Spo0J family partition protein
MMSVASQSLNEPPADIGGPATSPAGLAPVGEPEPPIGDPQQGDSRREEDGRASTSRSSASQGRSPDDSRREFRVKLIPKELIDPDPNQVRSPINPDSLDIKQLGATIETEGVISPPEVRPTANGRYQATTGWRRIAAAQRVKSVREILCIIRDEPSDRVRLTLRQLIENLQRRDLNPMELARAFDGLTGKGPGLITAKQLAKAIGKSEAFVCEHRQLLQLSLEDQTRVETGTMTFDQARAKLRSRRKGGADSSAGGKSTRAHLVEFPIHSIGHGGRSDAQDPLPERLETGDNVYPRYSGSRDPSSGIRVVIVGRKAEGDVTLQQVTRAAEDYLKSLNPGGAARTRA